MRRCWSAATPSMPRPAWAWPYTPRTGTTSSPCCDTPMPRCTAQSEKVETRWGIMALLPNPTATDRERMSQSAASPTTDAARLPRQIPYIIGNDARERLSFYGIRNILVQFLVSSVILAYIPADAREGAAKDIFHSFVIGVD